MSKPLMYYRSTDPEVLAAFNAQEAAQKALIAEGEIFAKHFGGKLLARNGITGLSLSGLRFDPPKDDPLWTKPDKKENGLQTPRMRVPSNLKAESNALIKDYTSRFPSGRVSSEELFKSMGTSWGNIMFSGGGFQLFGRTNAVYVATTLELNDKCQEILASEFLKAELEKACTDQDAQANAG